MLTTNRKYDFVGELTLKRSRVLGEQSHPKDDNVNWLFLNAGEHQFSVVYKIEDPSAAEYDKPFRADLAITMIETAQAIVELNRAYEVLRGEEHIGTVRLLNPLE